LTNTDSAHRLPAIALEPKPATPTPADDVVSKLERLAALKERGMLTDEEFSEQKNRLLA
jgi:hypothetical protein